MGSRFNQHIVDSATDDLLKANISVREVLPFGFARFLNEELNALYFVVIFQDGHDGFFRININSTDWIQDSIYYEVDSRLELRYDMHGELLFKYLHFTCGKEIDVVKMRGKEFIGAYQIKDDDIRTLDHCMDMLNESGIASCDSNAFKCFDSDGQVYVAIIDKGGTCGTA